MTDLSTGTHPETAWLIVAAPAALSIAALLVGSGLLHQPLRAALTAARLRQHQRRQQALPADLVPDPALLWVPPLRSAGQLLRDGLIAVVAVIAALGWLAPLWLLLPVALGLAPLLLLGLTRLAQARYVRALERDLTPSVGRLSALLRSGYGLRGALERLLADMPSGPLADEWRFLLERQGSPLQLSDGIATAQQVVSALAVQTPSPRHANFLNHLAVAVGQPQEVLEQRCLAAYSAMQSSDRRREETRTELAQMQYSGMAVGLSGVLMALYLTWAQWERVVLAYSSPLGNVVAVIVVVALLLPIVGGGLLARVEDVDY